MKGGGRWPHLARRPEAAKLSAPGRQSKYTQNNNEPKIKNFTNFSLLEKFLFITGIERERERRWWMAG